jgi:butyryl-CoA dehydrogenase
VLSRQDLSFLLYDWLNVCELTKHDRFREHSRQTFDAVLELSADIAAKVFAPHYQLLDHAEPHQLGDGTVELVPEAKAALAQFTKAGLMGGGFDEALGGLQLPNAIVHASMAWFQAANIALTGYASLSVGAANLLVTYGSTEQIDTWVRPIVAGRYFGTMCLSEPQAGSSLTDITTRAVRTEDGSYRITGTKAWISGGDHELSENIVHLVLARTVDAPPGVKGISLFIVPKVLPSGLRNDVALVGLNHKMGQRGTTNAVLNFGDGTFSPAEEPGAVGYLVGEERCGLQYMFHMMNAARVGVGLAATALGYAGYRHSVAYAQIRTQGRPLNNRDPRSGPVPIIEHPDVRRMLLAQKSYTEGALALVLYCATLLDEQVIAAEAERGRQTGLLLDLLTPIAKSWHAQWCVHANDLAIQIHGGYGYTRDYPLEQLYRDNRLNAIHEGTHGIHALDLLGRKVVMQNGAALAVFDDRIGQTIARARAAGGTLASHAESLSASWRRLCSVTASMWPLAIPNGC